MLVQLIIRDNEKDETLILLLDSVLDLIYVISTQDADDLFIQDNLDILIKANLIEVLSMMNLALVIVTQYSIEVLEIVDNILQLQTPN